MQGEPTAWASGGAPYGGTPAALPGTLYAANYDTGGQGVGYSVASVNGSANSYRSDGVDLETTTDTQGTTGAGAGYDVGWTATGQWFDYTVAAATAGTYAVSIRVASPNGATDGLHIASASGANLSGNINVPATGGWQAWTTVTATVTLGAGTQALVIDQDNGGWNLHFMTFTSNEGPYGGAPAAVPGTVEAANYDTGGQGVAYNVTSTNGSANSYRPDGVDLEITSDPQGTSGTGAGYDLGWTAAGQWSRYTVNVAGAGSYTLSLRLASPSGVTDGLHIADSAGTNLSGDITVPATGGWQAWTTVTATVTLPAGTQTLELDQDNGGWNVHYLSFASASEINSSAWYEVVNEGSGLCAGAAGGATSDGTAVQQLPCTGASSELWQFVAAGSGEYEVLNQAGQPGSEAWNITGGVGATASGALLQTWAYGGSSNTNELFSAKAGANGYYSFVADNSGLCIDTPGASGSAGVQLQQYTCNGTGAQAFSLVQPDGTVSNPFGPNVYVFTPSMPSSSVQSTLDSVFSTQQANQFGTQRYALLFAPGSYNVTANIGFYTSIMGLGLVPDAVDITGNLSVDAQWNGGNATENFWRSASNLEVTPSSGAATWAVAQAGPFRRIDVQGNLNLYPTAVPGSCCSGWASGGYIADSRVTGQVSSGGQQQWISRNSQFGSWSGSNYNMVFSGVAGAPAQSFPSPPDTVLATSPVTREEPFLYLDASDNYHVFVPSVQTGTSGTTWASGSTPGTSLPLSSFFIAQPSDTAAQINSALAAGQNLLFTPGVYNIDQTLQVNNPGTIILGMGMPTLVPQGGVDTMQVGDVPGVEISGLLFDAGPQNSSVLLTLGTQGSTANYSSDPDTVQDVFFRIGGDMAASATTSLVDNANYSIIDDIWAWRADHGASSSDVGWGVNPADTGLVVNGSNVTAYGLFVEHYEKTEIVWNGNNGEDIFLQNENPYDPPSQSAWMDGSQDGYPALYVNPGVTSFQGYGLGSYSYFDQGVNIYNAMAIQAPVSSGVQFHDMVTVFLAGSGGIGSIINGTGGAVSSSNGKSTLASYS